MSTGNIKFDKFLYLLSKNLVPSRSKFKKDKDFKCIYKNPYPKKLKSQ